jgi:hypothetical protein
MPKLLILLLIVSISAQMTAYALPLKGSFSYDSNSEFNSKSNLSIFFSDFLTDFGSQNAEVGANYINDEWGYVVKFEENYDDTIYSLSFDSKSISYDKDQIRQPQIYDSSLFLGIGKQKATAHVLINDDHLFIRGAIEPFGRVKYESYRFANADFQLFYLSSYISLFNEKLQLFPTLIYGHDMEDNSAIGYHIKSDLLLSNFNFSGVDIKSVISMSNSYMNWKENVNPSFFDQNQFQNPFDMELERLRFTDKNMVLFEWKAHVDSSVFSPFIHAKAYSDNAYVSLGASYRLFFNTYLTGRVERTTVNDDLSCRIALTILDDV